jgi:hypothetical protein
MTAVQPLGSARLEDNSEGELDGEIDSEGEEGGVVDFEVVAVDAD